MEGGNGGLVNWSRYEAGSLTTYVDDLVLNYF
jgi:hypothetical protein